MKNNEGRNLIFLISQPRAGSTLLQRILAGHPDIHTTAEPWIMLPMLYAFKQKGIIAEYNAEWAGDALEDFCETLTDGENTYLAALGEMAAKLYADTSSKSGKPLFLDKTPRYYHIIPELYRVFPKSRFVILLRNPLAVLASILTTWVADDWNKLELYRHDLIAAPGMLAAGIELLGEQCKLIHYEDMVSRPENEIQQLCRKLDLAYVPEMIEYGNQPKPFGRMGDTVGIHRNTRPVSDMQGKWMNVFSGRTERALADTYLAFLDQECLGRLGYDYHDLRRQLWSVPCGNETVDPAILEKIKRYAGLGSVVTPEPYSAGNEAKSETIIGAESQPLISIITPSYNQAAYIEETIQSVMNQGYRHFEHIVIDGGSTDGTLDILRKYPHLKWVSENDKGQADAINKGLRMARGEVVAYLNSDDYYLPGAFESVVRCFKDHHDALLVLGDCRWKYEETGKQRDVVNTDKSFEDIIRYWDEWIHPTQPSVFFRKQVIETVGEFDIDFHYAMDYEFWLRASQLGPFRHIDAPLAVYRFHKCAKSGHCGESGDWSAFYSEWHRAYLRHKSASRLLPAGPLVTVVLPLSKNELNENMHHVDEVNKSLQSIRANIIRDIEVLVITDIESVSDQKDVQGEQVQVRIVELETLSPQIFRETALREAKGLAIHYAQPGVVVQQRWYVPHLKTLLNDEQPLCSVADYDQDFLNAFAGLDDPLSYDALYRREQKQNNEQDQEQEQCKEKIMSVIIPTFNRVAELEKCLDALDRQTFAKNNFEVFVCDDGSTDTTAGMVGSYNASYRLHYLEQENSGPASARNRGIRQSSGKYLLIINDDSILEHDALELHYAAHLKNLDEKISVMGKFLLHPDYNNVAAPFEYLLDHSDLIFEFANMQAGERYDYNYFYTCNISLPRQAVIDAGLFDEEFTTAGAEDIELGYRLEQLGYEILYAPECVAYHAHRLTPQNFIKMHKVRGEGGAQIFIKHPELYNHYQTVVPEDIERWNNYDEQITSVIDDLVIAVNEIDSKIFIDANHDSKPFTEDALIFSYKHQWVMSMDDLLQVAERFVAELNAMNNEIVSGKKTCSLHEAAELIHAAVSFLKWHSDTIGIMSSTWVEDIADRVMDQSFDKNGIEKVSGSKVYHTGDKITPYEELFLRKVRESNMHWSAYYAIAGCLFSEFNKDQKTFRLIEEGVYCLERVIELRPYHYETLQQLVEIYPQINMANKIDSTASLLNKAVAPTQLKKTAMDFCAIHEIEKAMMCLYEELKRNKHDIEAAFDLFDVCINNGFVEEAEYVLEKYCQFFNGEGPYNFLVWYKKAELALAQSDYDNVIKYCELSLSQRQSPVAFNLMAQASVLKGSSNQAVKYWQQSLSIRPMQLALYMKMFDAVIGSIKPQRNVEDVSVNILVYTFNKVELFRQTLESLAKTNIGNAKIILLNNNSVDGTKEFLENVTDLFSDNDVKVINLPTNVGAPAARNWLLAQPENQEAEFVAYLDDDVLLPENWLQDFINTLDAYPQAGVVGGKVVNPDEPKTIQYIYRYLDMIGDEHMRLSSPHGYEIDYGQFDFVRKCLSIMGCCHLFRTNIAKSAGEFDIRFSPSQIDDIDHDFLIALSKYEIIYNGHVEIVHCQKAGKTAVQNRAAAGNVAGNDYKFALKHSPLDMLQLKQRIEEIDADDFRRKILQLREGGYLQGVAELPFNLLKSFNESDYCVETNNNSMGIL